MKSVFPASLEKPEDLPTLSTGAFARGHVATLAYYIHLFITCLALLAFGLKLLQPRAQRTKGGEI